MAVTNRQPYIVDSRETVSEDYGNATPEFRDMNRNVEYYKISTTRTADSVGVDSYKLRKEPMSGLIDTNYDFRKWSGLPVYDKRIGHNYWNSVVYVERNKHTKQETTITKIVPEYENYLPPVPTPVIYTNYGGMSDADRMAKITQEGEMFPDHVEGILTDVTHNVHTQKLNYHITLDLNTNQNQNNRSEGKVDIISDNIFDIVYLNWPPNSAYDKPEISTFDVNTLKGTSFEYLLVENPDVAAANNIDISDIIHKYKK